MHGRSHARLVVRVHVVVAALKRVVAQGCGGGLAIHVANQLLLLLLIERPFVVVRYGCNVVVVLVCNEGDDPAEQHDYEYSNKETVTLAKSAHACKIRHDDVVKSMCTLKVRWWFG